jgi:hypothetical protein
VRTNKNTSTSASLDPLPAKVSEAILLIIIAQDFMEKLEQKMNGVGPVEPGLLSSEGTKASDALELEFVSAMPCHNTRLNDFEAKSAF